MTSTKLWGVVALLRDGAFTHRKFAEDRSLDPGARYAAAVFSDEMAEEANAVELLAQIREAPR